MKYGNMLTSEDEILIKTCKNLKDFLPEDSPRNALTKIEKTNIGRLSAKVAHNQSNALQEAVGYGHPKLQISFPLLNRQLR